MLRTPRPRRSQSLRVEHLEDRLVPSFAAAVNYPAGSQPYWTALGDLDGDLDVDIAVANFASGNVSVLLNNGNGTFAAPVNYLAGTQPTSIAVADVDGDLDLDLLIANSGSDNV